MTKDFSKKDLTTKEQDVYNADNELWTWLKNEAAALGYGVLELTVQVHDGKIKQFDLRHNIKRKRID